jgi:hypothetical protein
MKQEGSMRIGYKRQLTVFGVIAIAFCVGGAVLMFLGYNKYAESRDFIAGAQSAEGKVTSFETFDSPGTDIRDDIHYAIVFYRTDDGQDIRFRGPSKDGLVRLRQGEIVRVLYHSSHPENARVDSFMGLWFAASILSVVGGSAMVLPLLTFWQALKWVKQQEGRHE